MVQTIQERIRTTTNGIITATIENPIKGLVARDFCNCGSTLTDNTKSKFVLIALRDAKRKRN